MPPAPCCPAHSSTRRHDHRSPRRARRDGDDAPRPAAIPVDPVAGRGVAALRGGAVSAAAAARDRRAGGRAGARLGDRHPVAHRRAALRPRECRRLCPACRGCRGERAGPARAAVPECRNAGLRRRADPAGRARHGDTDRHRRRGAARRRRGRDGRAYRTGRGRRRGDQASGGAGPVRLPCRLGHGRRRIAAARRHRHGLARDRHAGRLRHRRDRSDTPGPRRGAVDRRRTGPAGRTA